MTDYPLPPQTCPKIDSIKESMESATKCLEQALSEVEKLENHDFEDGDMTMCINMLGDADSLIEDVRSANESLRDAAEGAIAERDELSDEVSRLEKEIRALKSERDELQEESESLLEEIEELKNPPRVPHKWTVGFVMGGYL